MKILCDVHLPIKLVEFLKSNAIDAIHGSKILDGWYTNDADFCRYADENDFIFVTKDNDFRDSHIIKKTPSKLIKINLGNISNQKLIKIFSVNLNYIIEIFKKESAYIEINYDNISHIS